MCYRHIRLLSKLLRLVTLLSVFLGGAVAVASIPLGPARKDLPANGLIYDVKAAVDYANAFGPRMDNNDHCYIFTNDQDVEVRCRSDNTHLKPNDGAHFIDCALKAGQFAGARCNSLGDSWLNMNQIHTLIAPRAARPFAESAQAVPGDILILIDRNRGQNDPRRYCWGGVVVRTGIDRRISSSGIWVAAHSTFDRNTFDPNGMQCPGDLGPDQQYYRILNDTTPPAARFTSPGSGRVLYGKPIHLVWEGADNPVGAGLHGFTVQQQVVNQSPTDLVHDTLITSYDLTLDRPCRVFTFRVIATDNAGLSSPPDTLVITTTLQGDSDLNGAIDASDLALVEVGWGLHSGEKGFDAGLDINADGWIDAADKLWIYRHLGDRCF